MRILIILFISIVSLIPSELFAVDKVHLNDGSVFEGKITLIDPEQITLSQGEDKPLRVFRKVDIKVVIFEDGRVESFEGIRKQVVIPRRLKSPGTAALWSLLGGAVLPIQGCGQFYNGQLGMGFTYLGLGLLTYSLMISGLENNDPETAGFAAIGYLAGWIGSTVDAFKSAKRINENLLSLKPKNMNGDLGVEISYRG